MGIFQHFHQEFMDVDLKNESMFSSSDIYEIDIDELQFDANPNQIRILQILMEVLWTT